MLMVAIVLAAAAPQPSIGISGGPILFREGGRGGVGSGPQIRVDIGYPIAERAAAELWFTGAMESAPRRNPAIGRWWARAAERAPGCPSGSGGEDRPVAARGRRGGVSRGRRRQARPGGGRGG